MDIKAAIQEIQSQHAKLSSLAEVLGTAAMRPGASLAETPFAELSAFVASHFRFEEQVMQVHGYPMRERHAQAHARLLSELDAWRKAHDASSGADLFQHVEALWRWLLDHIDAEDQELVHWLQRKSFAAIPAPG